MWGNGFPPGIQLMGSLSQITSKAADMPQEVKIIYIYSGQRILQTAHAPPIDDFP